VKEVLDMVGGPGQGKGGGGMPQKRRGEKGWGRKRGSRANFMRPLVSRSAEDMDSNWERIEKLEEK